MYGCERRPLVGWLAAEVQRVVVYEHVDLHKEAEQAPAQAPDENDERHVRLVHADGLGQLLYGVGREGVNAPVALLVDAACRRDRVRRVVELGHQAVGLWARALPHRRTLR